MVGSGPPIDPPGSNLLRLRSRSRSSAQRAGLPRRLAVRKLRSFGRNPQPHTLWNCWLAHGAWYLKWSLSEATPTPGNFWRRISRHQSVSQSLLTEISSVSTNEGPSTPAERHILKSSISPADVTVTAKTAKRALLFAEGKLFSFLLTLIMFHGRNSW